MRNRRRKQKRKAEKKSRKEKQKAFQNILTSLPKPFTTALS